MPAGGSHIYIYIIYIYYMYGICQFVLHGCPKMDESSFSSLLKLNDLTITGNAHKANNLD